MTDLREAFEASWDENTTYQGVFKKANLALDQCYPTSGVIQFFFPETEIVEGEIWTGKSAEKHFWNLINSRGTEYHIDLTSLQFPQGSIMKHCNELDRELLDDSQRTRVRVSY